MYPINREIKIIKKIIKLTTSILISVTTSVFC